MEGYNDGPLECDGETIATTLRNRIFLKGSGHDFEADGGLVAHDFTHVLLQRNTGRLNSEKQYADEHAIWENLAYGYENAYTIKFEQCRKEKSSCSMP